MTISIQLKSTVEVELEKGYQIHEDDTGAIRAFKCVGKVITPDGIVKVKIEKDAGETRETILDVFSDEPEQVVAERLKKYGGTPGQLLFDAALLARKFGL